MSNTKFNQCPNCGKNPSSGLFGGSTTTPINECEVCGTKFCLAKCGSRCPNCGSQKKRKIGYCASR